MIQQLFPNRTRHQVKLKFKIEERKHPSQVHDALLRPSKDRTHVMQVIKQLQTRDKANFQRRDRWKKQLASRVTKSSRSDCEDEVEGPEELDDSKGEANSPSNFDEHQGLFEWDGATSPQDTEKDTRWEM
ncbi:hypothetical protein C4D60_Mb08t00020 [Musa balbisiana]|uniref:Transcription factor TFIIIB component B'' Myb domain-containing protein n=1 Tax=Musa balbisiana TaxID=52838 RepID=A0A4S8K060_MUSBA|nr:hypothetical protein C4D60_Mb08t00020 [Musa balbisiana]